MQRMRVSFGAVLLAGLLVFLGCGSPDSSEAKAKAELEAELEEAEEPEPEPLTGKHVVIMETTKGTIKMELDADAAPKTVANFLDYVDAGFYHRTIFHRVRRNFIIQGGGYKLNLKQKPTMPPVENESGNGLKNRRGTVAMARLKGEPDSATAQFFININHNRSLDADFEGGDGAGYTVFGKVIEGMDVADAISRVKTSGRGGLPSVPEVPVIIKSIRRAPAEGEEEGESS